MSSVTSPIFNGSSTFSSSFQQVLTRAVSIASLPMQQMQNDVSTLQSQQAAMAGLQAVFSSLQNDIQNVAAAAQGSLGASVSDSTVSATATPSALPGTYSIEVDGLGSSTTTLSAAGSPPVTDPTTGNISSSSTFTLTVNGTGHQISPSGTSLESLATAINDASVGAQATIVNVGSSTPDYRLAVSSNELGADTIQLSDGTNTTMLKQLAPGVDASYTVAGNSIQSNSRQVTLAPGLTVNLLQQSTSGQPATITVASNSTALENALSSFVTDYNSAVDAVSAQRGQNAGALEGQSLVYSLQNVLTNISEYSGSTSGSVNSLTDMGITLDQTGHLSFDQTAFTNSAPAEVQKFLGGITSGGFLQSANNALTAMADPTTGVIQGDTSALQDRITSENSQIADQQSRIDDLTTQLQSQLTAADAAIATLQEQKSYFTQLFQAQYPANGSGSA